LKNANYQEKGATELHREPDPFDGKDRMAQRQKELLWYKEASSQIRLEQQTSRLLHLP
jgi:hypothetical protein